MAYKVIILYRLYMPSYFLGTFTEYPELNTIFPGYISNYLFSVKFFFSLTARIIF